MEATEKVMTSEDLNDLSKKFLLLREAQWKSVGTGGADILKQEYKDAVKSVIDKFGGALFTTEDGYLLAKFAFLFGSGTLDPNTHQEIGKGLVDNAERFPVSSKIDRAITSFQQHCGSFFINSGANFSLANESFSLPRTESKSADLIIETEIKRMKVDQSTRVGGRGPRGTYSMTYTDTPNSFEISLKK